MEKGTITLTIEEAQVLINMINIAVKSVGLEAAESALIFTKKIQESFIPKKDEESK